MASDFEWEDFSRRFKASRPSVFKVAEYLNREKNCSVTIEALKLAPNRHEWREYQDDGDIIVNDKHIVEVKGKTVDFTSREDFPWDEMIVANVASADRYSAFAYFIVNKKLTHAGIIKGSSKPRWVKRMMQDNFRGTIELKYLCPIDLIEFVRL